MGETVRDADIIDRRTGRLATNWPCSRHIFKCFLRNMYCFSGRIQVKDCNESHSKCKLQSFTPLPDRVIHVGTDLHEPYLHINRGGESGRCVALSHCWGGTVKLKTEKHTGSQHAPNTVRCSSKDF
jgi:hypothetical protein